jgi:hypothetical protein
MENTISNQKFNFGTSMNIPRHRYLEHYLGFETDTISIEGIPATKINLIKVPNTREIDNSIELMIEKRWSKLENENNAFDNPRARFEGSYQDNETGELFIKWSDERYKNHAILKETNLPKPYQANPFTINGIPYTTDKKIPIVNRNPNRSDQGAIRHIAPAGFIDIHEIDKLKNKTIEQNTIKYIVKELNYSNTYKESPHEATKRELSEELQYKSNVEFPTEIFNPNDMKCLGIIYNSYKNFDYTASILIPLNTDSKNISLKGDEHVGEIEWYNTGYEELSDQLYKLAKNPNNNSGHLRGDIALTIGHLHGPQAYKQALNNVVLNLTKE